MTSSAATRSPILPPPSHLSDPLSPFLSLSPPLSPSPPPLYPCSIAAPPPLRHRAEKAQEARRAASEAERAAEEQRKQARAAGLPAKAAGPDLTKMTPSEIEAHLVLEERKRLAAKLREDRLRQQKERELTLARIKQQQRDKK